MNFQCFNIKFHLTLNPAILFFYFKPVYFYPISDSIELGLGAWKDYDQNDFDPSVILEFKIKMCFPQF